MNPLVVISSYPPRPCGIATFIEEAMEFVEPELGGRAVHIISHTDGEGANVHPIIDLSRQDWYVPVAEKVKELDPYAVHIEHEYGLYNHVDAEGRSDNNRGFLNLLDELAAYPTIVEPHTVHGRMKEHEEQFMREMTEKATAAIFKCQYQKWRLHWTFSQRGWAIPTNIAVIPHGARPDKCYPPEKIPELKDELGLSELKESKLIGLVGWIQNNKRWDVVLSMWTDLEEIIYGRTGERWMLLGAGDMRDSHHQKDYQYYVSMLRYLERKGKGKYYKFVPRGEIYYQVMAICDFIILPSVDETQSGTLARIISLRKPYITTAPMEGLTSQTLESEGGLLFTDRRSLRRRIVRLACEPEVRKTLSEHLHWYLENRVSWEVVAKHYVQVYEMACEAIQCHKPVSIPYDF